MKTERMSGRFGAIGKIALVAATICVAAATSSAWADETISANETLAANRTVSGTLTIASGVTLDLAGYTLTVNGLAGDGTITSSASGELHVDVSGTTANSSVAFTGNLKLVVEGGGHAHRVKGEPDLHRRHGGPGWHAHPRHRHPSARMNLGSLAFIAKDFKYTSSTRKWTGQLGANPPRVTGRYVAGAYRIRMPTRPPRSARSLLRPARRSPLT